MGLTPITSQEPLEQGTLLVDLLILEMSQSTQRQDISRVERTRSLRLNRATSHGDKLITKNNNQSNFVINLFLGGVHISLLVNQHFSANGMECSLLAWSIFSELLSFFDPAGSWAKPAFFIQ